MPESQKPIRDKHSNSMTCKVYGCISPLKFYNSFSHDRCCFTIFGLVFLQTLVKVWAELWAKNPDHLLPVHLAEGRAVHGAVGQTQCARIKLGALYLVADPLQDILCRPAVRADVSVPLTCRDRWRTEGVLRFRNCAFSYKIFILLHASNKL